MAGFEPRISGVGGDRSTTVPQPLPEPYCLLLTLMPSLWSHSNQFLALPFKPQFFGGAKCNNNNNENNNDNNNEIYNNNINDNNNTTENILTTITKSMTITLVKILTTLTKSIISKLHKCNNSNNNDKMKDNNIENIY